MQINRSFQLITAGSICGLGLIGVLTTSQATSNYIIWVQSEYAKSRLQANSELEAQRAKSTKDVADAYAKNQVTTFNELIVRDYILNKQPPQIDWNHTVDPSKKTLIYDKYRKCVGYALNGKFYFTLYYQGVCHQ